MKAFELINILRNHLNYEVQIETREVIVGVEKVNIDTFTTHDGPVFVIKADDE